MNSDEIKRATELWFCAQLRELPGTTWYASKGGEVGTGEAAAIVPPYGFVQVTDARSALPGSTAWLLTVKVAWLSHIGDTTSPEHSLLVRHVQAALAALSTTKPAVDGQLGLAVSGTETVASEDFTDEEEQIHGDVFTVAVGVG